MQAEFILGTAQLGSAYGINNKVGQLDHKQATEILTTAVDCGIKLLDTAEGYGNSEALIGRFYRDHPECGLKICTKLTSSLEESNTPLLSQIKARIEKSSDTLNGCPIDIYYLHSFQMCSDKQLMNALVQLKGQRFFRSVGVSIYEPNELAYILENRSDMIDVVQIPFNVFNASQWLDTGVLSEARKSNIAVIARSIYVQGLIFKSPMDDFVNSIGLSDCLAAFHSAADEAGVSYARYACDYVRGTSEISGIILGCETPNQIEDNALIFSEQNSWTDAQRTKQLSLSRKINQSSLDPRFWN